MYKTVRKGDASLQYTILPQTDQFPSNASSQSLTKPKPRIVRYTMCILMILIILSCVATPFLMNQSDRNLFASTIFVMDRINQNIIEKNTSRSQTKDTNATRNKSNVLSTTISSLGVSKRRDSDDFASSTFVDILRNVEEDFTANTASTDLMGMTAQGVQVVSENLHQSSVSSVPPSTVIETYSPPVKLSSSTPSALGSSKKVKMPRVTLKLRENETIPQMYMKAGIASYKKGNITTSVLAHGLSLEGLIFKTPEGTIKPWPQKWFFADSSSDFQWKGSNQMPMTIYIVLAGLVILACVIIVLIFYVQRKVSRRQRQNIEDPEVGEHEEDKSTLLGAEAEEIEDKE